jgi:two-component system, NtrC family, response regulator HydG
VTDAPPLVLVVDDESPNLESLGKIFGREGWRVALAGSGPAALDVLRREAVGAVVTDLLMPGMSGEELLRAVRTVSPGTEVVLMTAFGTVESAVAAMKLGAYDFITKPVKRHAIVKAVRQALERASLVAENRALRARLTELSPGEAGGLLGEAPGFRAVLDTLRQAAPTSATVLLSGESGTGKELAARLVHDLSPRAQGPFVPINCAAIPEGLLESELFGHERGAFTGAVARKEGRFERARGGTLLLDEVGEIPASLQVKLLRFLQDGVLERVGGSEGVRVDVRVVAATNRDLAAEVKAGRFREDLFYRLDVVSVRLPPLRERREDVPLLAMAFLRRMAEKHGKPVHAFTPAALAALELYPWPGNVRELLHAVERAVILCRGDGVDVPDLPESIRAAPAAPGERAPGGAPASLVVPLGTTLEEIERLVIRETLRETRGDKNLAAQILGIAARTIYRKLDRDEEGRLVEPRPGDAGPDEPTEA